MAKILFNMMLDKREIELLKKMKEETGLSKTSIIRMAISHFKKSSDYLKLKFRD